MYIHFFELIKCIAVYIYQTSEHRCTLVCRRDFWEISRALGIVDLDTVKKKKNLTNSNSR